MTDQMKPCPQCESPYGYYMDETTYACPECRNEWEPTTNKEKGLEVFDVWQYANKWRYSCCNKRLACKRGS